LPFVSLHVPAHGDLPEMVIATLTSLLALDYPVYGIVMVDDHTNDIALWRISGPGTQTGSGSTIAGLAGFQVRGAERRADGDGSAPR
jgi:cellulose synthase/poly-beta-1,6-N-acetylglucosamine synthase-like glycosyltransferase